MFHSCKIFSNQSQHIINRLVKYLFIMIFFLLNFVALVLIIDPDTNELVRRLIIPLLQLIKECDDVGDVTPVKCRYMKEWLNLEW